MTRHKIYFPVVMIYIRWNALYPLACSWTMCHMRFSLICVVLWGNQSSAHNTCTLLGRVTHISVSKIAIINSDDGLSPGRRQAIIQTNHKILLIGPLGTCLMETLIGIRNFSFKKMYLNMSSRKWRPFSPGLNMFKRKSKHNRFLSRNFTQKWHIWNDGCFVLALVC